MNRKISLIMAMGYLGMAGEAYANFQSPKPVQFYAGLSGGIQHMSGKRNESVFNAGNDTTSIFSKGSPLSTNNAHYSLFGGFSWNAPNVPIFIGPEIYIGRGHTEKEHRAFEIDPGTNLSRTIQTRIKQSNFLGGIIKVGANIPWQSRAYALLGADLSQFHYSTFYTPRSVVALGGIGDLPPASFATTKWLRGFTWGVGLEKEYKCFRLGADIRFIINRLFKASYDTNSGEGPPSTIRYYQ
ncbi:MAG: hypothetical protein ACOH2E_08700 [Candidatus Paracaedibacter sp.]